MVFRFSLLLTACVWVITPASAEQYIVKDQSEYFAAAKKVQAGDIIILANGRWSDFEIVLTGKGTKEKPIKLISEEPGKVILSGKSNLRIGGNYILVSGLVFKDGYSPTGEVISFRRSKEDLATNSRVTEVVIDHFNKPDRYESDYWVGMYGKNNRFDHNHLVGKSNQGVTFAVRLDSKESRENQHRIDHNYFGPRPILGSNGGETLRIGTSQYSMFESKTLVDNNYFERCDGEIEIISAKSGGNVFRGNVFMESRGALTLRHGDNNLVENNIFIGNGKDHTGGIRIINRNQTVRNNYMEGLQGAGFASALTVMNGVPNSPVNRYVQVENAIIEHNTVVKSKRISFAEGKSAERSAPPIKSRFANNLLGGSGSGNFVEVDDDISGIAFANNVIAQGKARSAAADITEKTVSFTRADNGLLYPDDPALASVGVSRDLKPVQRDQVGVSWYPKPDLSDPFGKGAIVEVQPGEDTLTEAVINAKSGDRIQLAPGKYLVNKMLELDRAITIEGPTGPSGGSATISYSRPSLFEIREGGNLRLKNLRITGDEAPDDVGNSVIRTTAMQMLANFVIEMDGVEVVDLDVNKSFDVIALGKGAFAERVTITNSKFSNITGTVVLAASETDDYGRYNAEYVTITNSHFKNVGRELANVYRGGTDESTFGPHFLLSDSIVEQTGKSANNASGASLVLHGVQNSDVNKSRFQASAPIKVVHTAGTPLTSITNNEFVATAAPVVAELMFKGEPRTVMSDNKFEGSLKP